MSVYLQPTGPIAARALLPGDPKRAMEIANRVLVAPRMSNLSRGLWGYHGETAAGAALTVQSTGIGAPSAAIVLHELASLGVEQAIRVGACIALEGGPEPGSVVIASGALHGQGTEPADAGMRATLAAVADPQPGGVVVAPMERYYDSSAATTRSAWRAAGAGVADLCTQALLIAGRELGVAVGAALLVAEDDSGKRLDQEQLEASLIGLGERAAWALLADGPQSSSRTATRD